MFEVHGDNRLALFGNQTHQGEEFRGDFVSVGCDTGGLRKSGKDKETVIEIIVGDRILREVGQIGLFAANSIDQHVVVLVGL
jgi:hypothetical protein